MMGDSTCMKQIITFLFILVSTTSANTDYVSIRKMDEEQISAFYEMEMYYCGVGSSKPVLMSDLNEFPQTPPNTPIIKKCKKSYFDCEYRPTRPGVLDV